MGFVTVVCITVCITGEPTPFDLFAIGVSVYRIGGLLETGLGDPSIKLPLLIRATTAPWDP
ncbi:MAG: hypothetical protein SNJ68_09585 [Cyanobacteriota bacterium]